MPKPKNKPPDRDELIRKIDFFEALEPWLVKKIAKVCIPRYYSKGDYVIRQGDTGLGLFFVVQGRFQVEIEKDGATQTVAVLKEEQVFGELAVVDNQPRSAHVVCLEDETECLLLTRDRCLKLMNKYPQVAIQMARALTQRLRKTDEMLVEEKASSPKKKKKTGAGAETGSGVRDSSASGSPAGDQEGDQSAVNGGTKGQIQDFLVGTFDRFYTMKAITRFSVAVIGCPVEVCRAESSQGLVCAVIGEVKVVFLPVEQDNRIILKANGAGTYRVALLRPASSPGGSAIRQVCWGRVEPDDRLTVRFPGNGKDPAIEQWQLTPSAAAGGLF